MIIYSHRGIDFDRQDKLPENSMSAFSWAATQGFGVELDMQLNSQGEIIVAHDPTATRWSQGKCNQAWSDIASSQMRNLEAEFGKIPLLKEVFDLAKNNSMHLAIHLKGSNQTSSMINALTGLLEQWRNLFPQILIFDCKLEIAKELRDQFPTLDIAASVATEEDMYQFNALTRHTLYALDQVIAQRKYFSCAWLDEWRPTLYEKTTFDQLRAANMKSVVISPELHKAENHPDARDLPTLEARWKKILALNPGAICTDYPSRIARLTEGTS